MRQVCRISSLLTKLVAIVILAKGMMSQGAQCDFVPNVMQKVTPASLMQSPTEVGEHFSIEPAMIGDIDGDGVSDLAVGEHLDDDGGSVMGAVWLLFMNDNGTIKATKKISETQGNFTGNISNNAGFGLAVSPIGDFDDDGTPDLLVGAPYDVAEQNVRGSAWILLLNPNGTVKNHHKIRTNFWGFTPAPAITQWDYRFAQSVSAIGDLDGNGVTDIAVGAMRANDGGSVRGNVWILFLDGTGTVTSFEKVSNPASTPHNPNDDHFGSSIASTDFDQDGIDDIVVSAQESETGGTIWILCLNANGTVKSAQPIYSTFGGFQGVPCGLFGLTVECAGDLDGDDIDDLIAGDSRCGNDAGSVWILYLNADGTVKGWQQIDNADLGGSLNPGDMFGRGIAFFGDMNQDGYPEIGVAASGDDEINPESGALWILSLQSTIPNCRSFYHEIALDVPSSPSCRAEVPVLMSNTEELLGFSMGLTWDSAMAYLEDGHASILPGSAWSGIEPDYWNANATPTACPDGRSGATLAVVISTNAGTPATLPADYSQEVVTFIFRSRAIGTTDLAFTDCLGTPPVENVVTVMRGGNTISVPPALIGGTLQLTECFRRGDANADGKWDISDGITILSHLFRDESILCQDAADSNDDGALDLADAITLFSYLFSNGEEPPSPFPACGSDPTEDPLTCDGFPTCP